METDTGSQAMGEMTPFVNDENRREPQPVQIVGRQPTSDEKKSYVSEVKADL
jgi:hypothetical protein